jgi:hypothetical protein
MSEAKTKDYQAIAGVVQYGNWLVKPDTKYNPEGVYSITLKDLSDAAKVYLEGEGVKLREDGGIKCSTKYKIKVQVGEDQWAEEEMDEDVMVGAGTEVIVVGSIFKSPKGNSFKPFKVIVTKLVEYVPDSDSLKPL